MQFKISKVILSVGLGGRTLKEIETIKNHFENLFEAYFKGQKSVITHCRKANAKFKIRIGTPMGIKITLRKTKSKALVKYLMELFPKFIDMLNYDKSFFQVGFKDHRLLKLQRYNVKSPDYGFNMIINYQLVGSRVKYRRINNLNLKQVPSINEAVTILKRYVE